MREKLTNPYSELGIALSRKVAWKLRAYFCSSLIFASLIYVPTGFSNPVAIADFEQDKLTEAKDQFLVSLKEDNKDTIALRYLARIALQEGELDDAEDYIEKAQKLGPNQAATQFYFAQIMAIQAMQASMFKAPSYAKKSQGGFLRALELNPDNVEYHQGLMSYYLQAPAFMGGDKQLALVEAELISKINPLQGYIAFASVYQASNEEVKVEQTFIDATNSFPDSAQIKYVRGMY